MANSVKSTCKVPKATICYWTQEDIEEEGEDEKICILMYERTAFVPAWFPQIVVIKCLHDFCRF